EVTVFDADGQLINSSSTWPPQAANVSHRAYFKQFKADPTGPEVLTEAVKSIFAGGWTTVIAHRLSGPGGVFLGVMARRI
ncbi:hypothetical protein ABTN40_20530, partial [Acinetobacter baumannii]